MSRSNNRRPNNVRGPTSALTEFLRESGITATSVARRAATRNAETQQEEDDQAVAGPSNQTQEEDNETRSSVRRTTAQGRGRGTRARSNLRFSGNASDDLDNSEPEQEAAESQTVPQTKGKKQRLTRSAAAKLKAGEKKKRGIKDSDDEIDEDDESYNAPSRFMNGTTNTGCGPKPAPGSFEICVKCDKRFTVTIYTMVAIPGPGWLCHPCAKAAGNDPFKKPQAGRKKKAPVDRRVVTNFEERRFPSLVSICVQLITKFIDDVEALGDIGALNVEAISKALSRNRSLTPENVQLFYNTMNTTLTLYDATNLPPDSFQTLGYLNPNLTSLRLDFCGQITDDAFETLSASLPALVDLELLGPFLVKPDSWQNFFTSHPGLQKFFITQSPRFDLGCLQALVASCGSSLRALRLKEIGQMTDQFLKELMKLDQDGNEGVLAYLDLSDPGESCEDEAMINLLSAIGPRLTHIDVSNHILLTSNFLIEGLLPYTKTINTLILNNLPELSDRGVASFFESWTDNPPLVRLQLSRNHELEDNAMQAILEHSGSKLEELNVNGWKNLGEDVLISLALKAPELRKADVGWVRQMTDFVIKAWVDGAPESGVGDDPNAMEVDGAPARKGGCMKLEEVKVWGCNRITLKCPRKKGMSLYGVEAHTVIKTLA